MILRLGDWCDFDLQAERVAPIEKMKRRRAAFAPFPSTDGEYVVAQLLS
jgi:hypothetical protein